MICAHNWSKSIQKRREKSISKTADGYAGFGDLSTHWETASEVVAGVAVLPAPGSSIPATGALVFRDRQELYERINQRVEMMFERGVIEEVRTAGETSQTASQMIGLREIRELLAGKKSIPQCIAEIQQATRRYAKRQLTWFRRQTNFLPLNLSFLTHKEAVKWISLRILSEAGTRDD